MRSLGKDMYADTMPLDILPWMVESEMRDKEPSFSDIINVV